MKKLLPVVCVVLLLGADKNGDGNKDQEKLQGVWRYVSFESNGEKMPEEQLKRMSVIYDGDKWTVKEGDKVVVSGTQKLDPSKKPAQIDSVITEGEGKGTTMLGIYELKGDRMRVCFDPAGKERPKDFKPKGGQFGGVIERVKQK
jgi:uncharacterized protein (TIGR03067 family)